jgi:hypothetical protein
MSQVREALSQDTSHNTSNSSALNNDCAICHKLEDETSQEVSDFVYCNFEHLWYHRECLGMSKEEFSRVSASKDPYKCKLCLEKQQLPAVPEQEELMEAEPIDEPAEEVVEDDENVQPARRSRRRRAHSGDGTSQQEHVIDLTIDRPCDAQAHHEQPPRRSPRNAPGVQSAPDEDSSQETEQEEAASSSSSSEAEQDTSTRSHEQRDRERTLGWPPTAGELAQRAGRRIRQTCRKSTATPSPSTSGRRQAVDPYKDSDGYAEVTAIVGHRGSEKNREFQIQWADNSLEWVKWKDCDGCVDMIKLYCRTKRIVAPKDLTYKKGCGFVGSDEDMVEENWASLDDILERAKSYGNRCALQPFIYKKVPNHDAIMVTQIGNHCFVILYYHDKRIAIIADGLNVFSKDDFAQRVIRSEFDGINVINIPFFGQNRANQCASSAVAIIIELQKAHQHDAIPSELRPERVTYQRIVNSLHPVEEPALQKFKSIDQQQKGVTVTIYLPNRAYDDRGVSTKLVAQ